ncbi:MAG: (Fe-S)-binding protein, partial [Phycisphaerae bacterium]|nr:(Fe-S)-binding protein [Phycisphaerae bacterium]
MILANVIIELINNAWLAGVIMLALGFVFALVLLIAHEKLKVEVDPKVEQVYEALPHLDCGACGYAGCSSYAKAVIGD